MAKMDAHELKLKVQKKYPDFVEVADTLSVQDLESRLLSYSKERVKIKEAKEADSQLKEVTEVKATLESPYRDATTAIDLKSRYLVALMKEKGANV